MIENLTKSLDVQRKLIFNLNEVSNLATNGDPAACATRSGWRNTCDQDARGAHVMIGVKYFPGICEFRLPDCRGNWRTKGCKRVLIYTSSPCQVLAQLPHDTFEDPGPAGPTERRGLSIE